MALKRSLVLVCLWASFAVVWMQSSPLVTNTMVRSSTRIWCEPGHLQEAPIWHINGSAYDLLSIPQYFPSIPITTDFSSLIIWEVPREWNNTIFECAFVKGSGLVHGLKSILRVFGARPTRLRPARSYDVSSSNLFRHVRSSDNSLLFNYQELDKEDDVTTIGWKHDASICNLLFNVQGYIFSTDLMASNDAINNITTATRVDIPSNMLVTNEQPVYFRVVAIDEDGEICSNLVTQRTFYRLDASQNRQTKIIAPHITTTCYDIPETNFCISLTFVLSLKNFNPVFCPIHNSSIGWSVFRSCISRLEGDVIPYIHTNGSVCLDSPFVNETTLHFQCSTEPCRPEDACFVNTVVVSHKIVLVGPPTAPSITYNYTHLCFTSFAHEDYPIENFTIQITDFFGDLIDHTDRYNHTGSPTCIDTTMFNVCPSFSSVVTVINSIGQANGTFSYNSIHTCPCYEQREMIDIRLKNVSGHEAFVKLLCGMNNFHTVSYFLENEVVNFSCGETKQLTGLLPNTMYSLIRQYADSTNCSSFNFTTLYTESSSTTSVAVTMNLPEKEDKGIMVVLLLLPLLILLVLLLMLIAICTIYLRSKKFYNVNQKEEKYPNEQVPSELSLM